MDEVEQVDPVGGAARRPGHRLEEWVGTVAAELGVDRDVVDAPALLDLAREAADAVGRPAAPLTTFLVGYAAGQAGGDPAAVDRLTAQIGALARQWAEHPEHPEHPERPARAGQPDTSGAPRW